MEVGLGGEVFDQCPGLATETVTAGCEHEHVRTRSLCRSCVRAMTEGEPVLCQPCYLAGFRVPVIALVESAVRG
jgi:hypothetical protein